MTSVMRPSEASSSEAVHSWFQERIAELFKGMHPLQIEIRGYKRQPSPEPCALVETIEATFAIRFLGGGTMTGTYSEPSYPKEYM